MNIQFFPLHTATFDRIAALHWLWRFPRNICLWRARNTQGASTVPAQLRQHVERKAAWQPVLGASSLHRVTFPVQSRFPTWRESERARQAGRTGGGAERCRRTVCGKQRRAKRAVSLRVEDAARRVRDVRRGPRPVSPIFKQHLKPIQDI